MSYDITKDLEGVCGHKLFTSEDQRMKFSQSCNGCPACEFEQANLEDAPPGYGHHFCYYTGKPVSQFVIKGTFSVYCPLIQNEREKERLYPKVMPVQSIASPDE